MGSVNKGFKTPRRSSVIHMPSNYEQAFGHSDRKFTKNGVHVWDEKKKEFVHIDETASAPTPSATAIHDDRLFNTAYDPGLGCGYSSRTERRAIMKAAGLQEAR